MKRRILLLVILSMITFCSNAQTDYSDYLNKAMEKVEAGDCDAAQRFYNVYKELTGNNSSWLEKAMKECEEKSKSQRAVLEGYVDLGLPSGTLWKDKNEDGNHFYTWNQAIVNFGNNLPTIEQLEELKTTCKWIKSGNNFKVIGPNGKSIVLQASGYRFTDGQIHATECGYYWSLSSTNEGAWCMICLDTGGVLIINANRNIANPVRLVKFNEKNN